MKHFLLPLLLTSFLFSNALYVKQDIIPIDETFTIDSSADMFDTNISYTHKPLLLCSPQMSAVYKIESATKLKVIPKESLYSGTKYSCQYDAYKFSFKTENMQVKDAHYFKAERLLRLSFSDNIDIKTLLKGVELKKVNKLSKTKLHYTTIKNSEKEMILQINEPLQNSNLSLKITKELKTTHGTSLLKSFEKNFNEERVTVRLNSEKKAMIIHDSPQMVALNRGGFAIRLFTDDTLEGKIENYIHIQGVENFRVNKNNYINYHTREEFKISDEPYYYTDIISDEFKPNSNYTITLAKGLQSYRELKEDKSYTLKSADRAKSIVFENDKNYISNIGEVGFSSVNIDSATVIVERILDENLRYFMNFSLSNTKEVPKYSQEILTKEIKLNNQKNIILKQKFSLKSLAKKLPYGVYKITLRYNEIINKEKREERSVSKVLFLSDLGISLNLAKEQAFVTVLSLSSAKPIENATVEIYASNNELLGVATTNKDGIAIIEQKNLLEKKPIGVMVKTNSDSNFLTLNKLIDTPSANQILTNKERFKAYVYFQSNILRPASMIHAMITLKDRNFISADKLPVKLILKEMYGKTLHEKVYHTDSYGIIDFNYQLDKSDKTGNYLLQAFIGDKLIGEKKLKVEAFIPPKIENHIQSNKEAYQASELIELNISSSYLFGSPASELYGSVKLNTYPINFSHENYANYSFNNQNIGKKSRDGYLEQEEKFRLNREGKISLVLPTKISKTVPSILEGMIGVTIMDDTQPLSTYKKIKIYPYKAMVGLYLEQHSFEKGQKLKGKAVLINPLTGEVIKRKLYAVVKKIDWQYDYSDGHYNWQKETTVVENFTIESNREFTHTINDNGDYIIEVHDRLGGHSASSDFDVWWWSYSNISPKNDLKSVEINFEDRLYKKGDELEVSIKSPILEGQLLLTLESDRVELYRRIKIEKGVAKVTLPINIDMKRGLHIHATAIRPSNSPSKLIPFRAMGYKFVKPNRNEHKIGLTIDAPKVIKSKTSLTLNIKTDKPSKVLVSIVDRGILQLVEQKRPTPFDFFNEPATKKISYYDLYDQLMSYVAEGQLIDFGAGDIAPMRIKHLAPDLGKRIKPFMIWSGIIDIEGDEGNITIDIPEFNGRASIVAIAINEDAIGASEQDIQIKDDIMLKPSYPKYALVGDTIDTPLRIFNTTNKEKHLNLTTKLSDNLSFILTESSITIPPNSSKIVQTNLVAKRRGKGLITLMASDGNITITKSVELPIYSPYALSTHTFKGISNQSKTFTAPKEYRDAKVMITLSNNLIGALRDDLNYLVQYPYGCAEQTSSKLSAMHYAEAFLNQDRLIKDSENFIRQGVKKLLSMQNYYGEFNYWQGGDHVHAYASLYAAQTLLELKRDGQEIPKSSIQKIITMLNSIVSKNDKYEGSYTNFHRIYAGFILAENKSLSESTANMLYEKKIYKGHFLSNFYMAAILKMQGRDKEANTLYNKNTYELARYANREYGNRTGNFESNVRDMLLHFIIKTTYFKKEAKDLMVVQKEFSNLYSTQTKAIALKAISTYLGKPKNSKVDIDIEINGQKENHTKPTTIIIEKLKNDDITLTPKGSAMSYAIELIKHLPKKPKNELSTTKELSIMREFIDEKGNPVELKNLIQGNKIYSKVTIVNYGEIKNVVVSQPIPACLNIVNNNIKEQKARFKDENIHQEYREIRDDRVLNFINLRKKHEWSKRVKKYINIENRGVIYTPLMVTTKGECRLPAIIIEAMYDTRINDYAKESGNIVVKDLNVSIKKEPSLSKNDFDIQAKNLVLALYKKEMNSNDANEFVDFFHYPLSHYYRTQNASKEFIYKDKQNYFKEWSKRYYSNIKVNIVKRQKEKAQVKIIFDYLIKNEKKELKGVSKHLLTVENFNGKLYISNIELVK